MEITRTERLQIEIELSKRLIFGIKDDISPNSIRSYLNGVLGGMIAEYDTIDNASKEAQKQEFNRIKR